MDRILRDFIEKQAARLLEAAKDCKDAKLQVELLSMAESWMRSLDEPGHLSGYTHSSVH